MILISGVKADPKLFKIQSYRFRHASIYNY
jgi:hypothetical protein